MGITKWRGSILHSVRFGKIIPTFHPADVLPGRSPHHRPIVVQDLKRCRRESGFPDVRRPEWNFTIRPTLERAQDWLADHTRRDAPLVADIETMGGFIDCIGFASSRSDAISIPFFLSDGTPIWSPDEETHLILQIRDIMQSSDMIFHNAIYDCQVIAARWGFMPRLTHDTMAMQHVAFPGLLGGKIDPISGRVAKGGSSLSLSFISSMYCEFYRYWKDDGKLWDPAVHSPDQRWTYNCEDCVRTFECFEELWNVLAALGLTEQYLFEMQLFAPAFDMMFAASGSMPPVPVRSVRSSTMESSPFSPGYEKVLATISIHCPLHNVRHSFMTILHCPFNVTAKQVPLRLTMEPLRSSDGKTLCCCPSSEISRTTELWTL
jgi:hypothetical protein